MALVTSGSLSDSYQKYFSKMLLERQLPILQMEQFAVKATLPRKNGNKEITFFRYDNPSISNIVEITSEGTNPGSNERQLTLSTVTGSLKQYASLVKLSTLLEATNLFDSLSQATTQLSEDHALHADTLVHRILTLNNTDGTGTAGQAAFARYAQNGTNSTNFIAASAANSAFTALDLLDATTALRVEKAPTIKGGYVLVADPRTARSVLNDDDYIQAHHYNNTDSLLKGEVGTYYGIKTLLSHNVLSFGSSTSTTIGSAGDYNASTRPFLANIVLGDQAFGVPSLTGDSPYSPKVLISSGPDKNDPLDLQTVIALKTYYTSVRLNTAFYRVVFSRSEV